MGDVALKKKKKGDLYWFWLGLTLGVTAFVFPCNCYAFPKNRGSEQFKNISVMYSLLYALLPTGVGKTI